MPVSAGVVACVCDCPTSLVYACVCTRRPGFVGPVYSGGKTKVVFFRPAIPLERCNRTLSTLASLRNILFLPTMSSRVFWSAVCLLHAALALRPSGARGKLTPKKRKGKEKQPLCMSKVQRIEEHKLCTCSSFSTLRQQGFQVRGATRAPCNGTVQTSPEVVDVTCGD